MNKTEFSDALRRALGKLPSYEVEQSIAFYTEMIDDRMEDGMSEQDAVAALGPVGPIAAQIIAETPVIPKAIAKANTGSRTLNIVLLAVFSFIWVPIAFALAVAVLAVYLSIWAVIVSLWIVVGTLLLCAPIGILGAIWLAATGYPLSGVWMLGCGLFGAGLGLFSWFGVLAASKGLVKLTHTFGCWIKGLFVKKQRNSEDMATPAYEVPTRGGIPSVPPQPAAPHTTPTYPVAPGATTAPFPPAPQTPAHGNPNLEGAQNHDHRA